MQLVSGNFDLIGHLTHEWVFTGSGTITIAQWLNLEATDIKVNLVNVGAVTIDVRAYWRERDMDFVGEIALNNIGTMIHTPKFQYIGTFKSRNPASPIKEIKYGFQFVEQIVYHDNTTAVGFFDLETLEWAPQTRVILHENSLMPIKVAYAAL